MSYKFKVSPKQLKKSYDLRMAALGGDRLAKGRLEAYKKRMKEQRKMAYAQEWIVDGLILNRQKMMQYIVAQVSMGNSLPEICDVRGMPSMQEVYSWFDNHPDFLKDYDRAEEIRGHRMGEKAIEIAKDTDRENVSADKLKVETLLKAAARANKRYQEKQIVETRDEYASMSPDQVRARVRAMLEADPSLLASLPQAHQDALGTSLPALSSEALTLDPEETDTPE